MRPAIDRLRLVSNATSAMPVAVAEFPTVRVSHEERAREGDAAIDAEAWTRAESFAPFDAAVEAAATNALTLVDASPPASPDIACEVLTRFQRFLDRRNAWSRSPLFDAVLAEHRAMHDVSKPLVKADLDHARDTWQWLLRLSPSASLAVQLAALFHDVERLESEVDARVEQHAPDYRSFKDRHAKRGGELAREALFSCGVDPSVADRVREIVGAHERRGHDVEVDLLNDADALSFFSLNSAGYADYFGREQTRKKIAYTLGRLSRGARARLARVRLRADVAELSREADGR